ncbi:MAG: transcriptional repressor [Bacilli bacterium]|nr:transcriptional repressor [Bacilli bacterium]
MKYSDRRECIYQRIKNSYDHPTAEKIYEDVRKTIPNISLGTVYRNLNQLVEEGYIRKITNLDENAHYDKIDMHAHMRCSSCERILDLEKHFIPDIAEYVEEKSGNKILSQEILLTGICKECRKKEKI